MASMDISPAPVPPLRRNASSGSTPVSHHKRMRDHLDDDTDYMSLIAEQALPRQKVLSPPSSIACTPQQSPKRESGGAPCGGSGGAAYGTPLAGFASADSATLALRLGVRWASHQRQGPRSSQEDCVVCKMDDRGFEHAYFGVFDGHGGCAASEYAACRLHDNVLASGFYPADALTALQDGFLRTDAELLARAAAPPRRKDDDCGTAAVVMLATADGLALAHAGDCRAILVKRSGSPVPFVELTNDHSADRIPLASGAPSQTAARPDEVLRVTRVGGRMDAGGYVCVDDHSLPMTRALGDLPLKVIGTGIRATVEKPGTPLVTVGWCVCLVGLAMCAVVQLGFLHRTLANSPVTYGVPTYQTLLTLLTILLGGIFFSEFKSMGVFSMLVFCSGVGVALFGVALHTTHRSQAEAKERAQQQQGGMASGGHGGGGKATGGGADGGVSCTAPCRSAEEGRMAAEAIDGEHGASPPVARETTRLLGSP